MTTESTFRSQLSNFGWARAEPAPISTSQGTFFDRLNPFNANGYVRLPSNSGDLPPQLPAQSRGEEDALFNLSRWDRMIVFAMLVLGSAACFFIAFFFLPLLALKPRKFVTLWTVGSLLFISSFAALQGPAQYAQHLVSGNRLPFTAAYFGSMATTLYFSLGLNNTILTLLSAAVQMIALLWYLVSYFPMGTSGMRFAGNFLWGRVQSSLS